MERFVFSAVLFAAVFVSILSGKGFAQETFTFYADSDAWVNEANPDANYGNFTYVSVKDRSGSAESYLKFKDEDIARLSGRQVSSASLFMYQYAGTYSPGDTVNVHAVSGDWSEASLTWNTKPAYVTAVSGSLELSQDIGLWREFVGLKDIVAGWQSAGNYGLALENNMDGKANEFYGRFYSSEYSDKSLRPYMKVTVTPEPVSMLLFTLGGGAMAAAKMRRKEG
jgi:hypothetical protein